MKTNKRTISIILATLLTMVIVTIMSKKEEAKLPYTTWSTGDVVDYALGIDPTNLVCDLEYGFVMRESATTSDIVANVYVYVPKVPFPTKFVIEKAKVTAVLNGSNVMKQIIFKLKPIYSNVVQVTTIMR